MKKCKHCKIRNTLSTSNNSKYCAICREEIISFYEEYGAVKTEEKYPNINFRNIVFNRQASRKTKPRLIRWTDDQLIDATRMAGLVPYDKQVAYFNRPNAKELSIKYLWSDKLKMKPANIHGLSFEHGQHISKKCPSIKFKYKRVLLWTDLENHLKPSIPQEIKSAVETLAKFQRWLFKSENPKQEILRIMKEGRP